MRNSLIFKLMGAFLLVIAIGSLVISALTTQATQNAFTLYTTRSGQVWAQRLVPVLADYYVQTHGWNGVAQVLQFENSGQYAPSGLGVMGQGNGFGAGHQAGGGMMTSMMDQRLILVDPQGFVISDTSDEWVGKQISATELKLGAPILVENELVGTILVTPGELVRSGTPAAEFLTSVNRAIVSSTLIAGIIALILGGVLFIQITAPLRQLRKAASAIAQGDLNQRVEIHSRDELGELGQAFNDMAQSLTNAETQRQHLAADVAHELRTPLTAIQGTLEGMQDGILPLDAEQVAALHAETSLLNRLVGDLRLLSLAEAGQLKLEYQQTEPGVLLQFISERARIQTQPKNIQLKTDIQADLPSVWMDADRITQVVNNLIGNAIRYTPEGGTITLEAWLLPGSKDLQISVMDTGFGIDSENLQHVFERFYRADKSRARASGGSGLGLAIVKQLVEAHGGKVKVESPIFQINAEPAYGTKFSFTLPVKRS